MLKIGDRVKILKNWPNGKLYFNPMMKQYLGKSGIIETISNDTYDGYHGYCLNICNSWIWREDALELKEWDD